MQLNDVKESVSSYQAFVALSVQTDNARNSIDTDTSSIGIGALLSHTPKYTVTANITACD